MFAAFPSLYKLLDIGPTGVDLFFVLSGFLITGILLDTRDSANYFTSFYFRRALRILPLYFIAVAAFFWVQLPAFQSQGILLDVPSHEQLWYWSFLVNWRDAGGHMIGQIGSLWSLGVEEQFYLVWPLIVFLCAARYFPGVCAGVIGFTLALRIALLTGHIVPPELLHEWIHRATVTRIDTLAIGATVAVLVRRPDWAQHARSWIKVVMPASLAGFLLCWLAGSSAINETIGYSIVALCYGCIVLVCVMDKGSSRPLCRIARNGVLRSLGRYSYAMYVLHLAVLHYMHLFAFRFIVPRIWASPTLVRTPYFIVAIIAMTACVAGSYLVALVSWNLLEKHFLRLKDRAVCTPLPGAA